MDLCVTTVYVESGVMLAWIVFICALGVCNYMGKLEFRFVSGTKVCPQTQKDQNREEIESLRSELETERQDREEAQKRIAYLTSELETESVVKEEALKRLSSIMSSRLRDGNPNIADLSDENRPVKIGEQFSELYDNQWADAYGAFEKHVGPGVRENDIIKLLLDILEQCFMLCKELGEKQLSLIRENVSRIATLITKKATHLPEDLMQRIKEERKIFAKEELPSYDKALLQIKEIISIPTDVLDSRALNEFVNECLKIWSLMLVQDPPMTMILKHERNENDKFKACITKLEAMMWLSLSGRIYFFKKGEQFYRKGWPNSVTQLIFKQYKCLRLLCVYKFVSTLHRDHSQILTNNVTVWKKHI